MTLSFFEQFQVFSVSDTGAYRPDNQDNFTVLKRAGAFFVADGMGGGSAGEEASSCIIAELEDSLRDTERESPGERRFCTMSAIQKAHAEILEYAKSQHYNMMGSTVAGIIFDTWNPFVAVICHVGDSRVYRWRNAKLELLTQDHTLQSAFDLKKEKLSENLGRLLTKVVGMKEKLILDWKAADVCPDDCFLICSDGLSHALSDDAIARIIRETASYELLLPALIDQVHRADGHDNTTIIFIKVPSWFPAPQEISEIERKESNYMEKLTESR